MILQEQIANTYEQLIAAYSYYAATSSSGEVKILDGLCIANSRQALYTLNIVVPRQPISSQDQLADLVDMALDYFRNETIPWVFFGSNYWLGTGAQETLGSMGFKKQNYILTGMIADSVAAPCYNLSNVELKRIRDCTGGQDLADLNSTAYNMPLSWMRNFLMNETFWSDSVYGYVAYINNQPAAGAVIMLNCGQLYVNWVVTAPAYRRQGLSDLVVRHCLDQASQETGVMRTALHGTPAALSIYLKMGYRAIDSMNAFKFSR